MPPLKVERQNAGCSCLLRKPEAEQSVRQFQQAIVPYEGDVIRGLLLVLTMAEFNMLQVVSGFGAHHEEMNM